MADSEPAPGLIHGPTSAMPSHTSGDAPEVVHALRKARLRSALFDEPIDEHWIGRYRVVDVLGRGGMGTVLEVEDDRLERRVALKLLHRDVPTGDQGRLLREARALARLSHPNVVQVHEVAEDPRPFIVMELIRGQTLDQWQRERPPWRACVNAYLQAGRGLAAVHEQQLVHRDFKPSNCIIDDEGRVRVMDFGLVRTLMPSTAESTRPEPEEPVTAPSLTQTGAVLGTLAYMSLEQLEGREVDARGDQFGFCISLHEALYGRRPFEGRTAAALCESMRHDRMWSPPRRSPVPLAVRRVLVRGLAVDPDERWPSMNALLDALETIVRPRWRGRLAIAALAMGASLAMGSAWYEMTVRQACAAPREQLADIWDSARREQVSAALLGSKLPFAEDAWRGTEPRLDRYADRWVESWTDNCEASQIREDQPASVTDRRSACLHRRKVALREAVAVLATAEDQTVERAIRLVSRLPRLERCDDVAALLTEVPPPDDPRVHASVREQRDHLAEIRALRIAGNYAQSRARLDALALETEALEHGPLRAEFELARGWTYYGQGLYDDATSALKDAYSTAVSEGHDAVATDAAALLSYLEGRIGSKHDLGLQWSIAARAHAQRPAAPPEAFATALANVGAVYYSRGDLDLAVSSYEDSIAQQEALLGEDDVRLAFPLSGLGGVLVSLDRLEDALEAHQRALALRSETLGPSHPAVAMSINNIGVVFVRQGRLRDATDHFRRALEIKGEILGHDHPELLTSLNNLGGTLMLVGELDDAQEYLERALKIDQKADDPATSDAGSVLLSLGNIQVQRGNLEDAERLFDRALSRLEQFYGPSHPKLIRALDSMALAAVERSDYAAATPLIARSREIVQAKLPPRSPMATAAMMLEARIAREHGDLATAREHAELAMELYEEAGGSRNEMGKARLEIARILVDEGHANRALELAREIQRSITPETPGTDRVLKRSLQALLEQLEPHAPG